MRALCSSPYCCPLLNAVSSLVMFAKNSRVFSSGDTRGTSHAREQRNKQLRLRMDALPSSLLCIEWKRPPPVGGRSLWVCLWRERCVGVGSIPDFCTVLSILYCCNAVVSYTGDDDGLCSFTRMLNSILYIGLSPHTLVYCSVYLAGGSFSLCQIIAGGYRGLLGQILARIYPNVSH